MPAAVYERRRNRGRGRSGNAPSPDRAHGRGAADGPRLLPFTVAHEYHHLTAFARGPGTIDQTVQGRLVFEGKADVFASRLQPNVGRPWHRDYAADDWQRCWKALRGQLNDAGNTVEFTNDYLIARTGRAPRFCGYAAGRRLLLRYLVARPHLSPAAWSAVPADSILAGVGADWTP